MSIVRIALRIAAVEALKGRTLVGDNVLDSEIGALDTAANGAVTTPKDRPFISVYSDDSSTADHLTLRSLTGNGSIDILFEASIATPHLIADPDTDQQVIVEGVPATDANFEFMLDLVIRQIADALVDPDNEWANIFNAFSNGIIKVQRARVGSNGHGARLAAHQLKLTYNAITDPVRGVDLPVNGALHRFFEKAESDLIPRMPTMEKNIALMKAQIHGDADALKKAMRRYGLIHDEADAMLITRFEGTL